MSNEITIFILLGTLFKCVKFQDDLKKKLELCHFFHNVPKLTILKMSHSF